MSVLTLESFIVECKHNNGMMVLLKTLCKTVHHKVATKFHHVHCVSLSIFNVLTQSFSVLKVFAENVKYYVQENLILEMIQLVDTI